MARATSLSAADISRCPHRVALERAGSTEARPAAISVEIQRRIRDATQQRESVLAQLRELHPSAPRGTSSGATHDAMANGAPLIVPARLSDHEDARRHAAVDLLVRTNSDDDVATYAPVIIKNNEVVDSASTRRLLEGTLSDLRPDQATWTGGVGVRRNDVMMRNGLTLAHAMRVLESTGHADDQRFGGVIDRHQRLWWFDLDSAEWGRWRLASYDALYGERLEILRRLDDWTEGAGAFPTEPFWHRECTACPFGAQCESALEAHDDVSLVRFTSLDQQILLREHGIATRQQLARLDPELSRRVRGTALPVAVSHSPEEHLGRSIDKLDDLIYRARVIVRGGPLRIVASSDISCPRADVEVDVDMESYNDVTYLWGAFVTNRTGVAGVVDGYVSFVSWDRLDASVESHVFRNFWEWFANLRQHCDENGASFAAYCFWAQAENGAMNRAANHADGSRATLDELEAFRNAKPAQWVDLHDVVKHQIQTDGPLGLKSLARGTGFAWREENPSGEASMTWYEDAVRSQLPDALAARQRLLEYNEDDCRATRALREWLNDGARLLAHRDECP